MSAVDTLWLTMATFLVLLMQAGFLLLEGGRVRSKSSINVAQKNASDLAVSWVCFTSFGFLLMYGAYPPLTEARQAIDRTPSPMEFVYQLAFCAAAASIISGAIAERMSFKAYLALTVAVSGFIYPLTGRLIWGDMFNSRVTAWLSDLGFIDFAGSTVVHGVGGWAGLTAIIMIGARSGRFDDKGNATPLPSHSSVLSLVGVLLLLFCWLGFNGGSLSPSDPALQRVLISTLSAAAFGAMAGMVLGAWLDKGIFNPTRICNGLIGSLVAITAGVMQMSTIEAIVVGSLGGLLATCCGELILNKFKLDDPVDVVSTHGIAGAFGTLAVAFTGPVSTLPAGSRALQFGVQLSGVVLIFILVTLTTWITLKLISRFIPLRVSIEDENLGLNYTEHGESVGSAQLKKALDSQISSSISFAGPLDVASNDEHSELAASMNQLLHKHEQSRKEIHLSERRFHNFAETASNWLWETDSNLNITFFNASNKGDRSLNVIGQPLLEVLNIEPPEDSVIQQCIACLLYTSPSPRDRG